VRSEDEKAAIEAKAVEVAGEGNVTNQLPWRLQNPKRKFASTESSKKFKGETE
jgi:hypothetical protein